MPPRPLVERFWPKVDKAGPTIRQEFGPCWVWTGKVAIRGGYGIIIVDGRERKASRAAFFLAHGRWPEPMACHHCDNPPCVKAEADALGPAHIYEGTAVDNGRDAGARGRTRLQKHPELARGELSPRHKLTAVEVDAIRSMYAAGSKQKDLGAQYGVSQAAISLIITGRNWPERTP